MIGSALSFLFPNYSKKSACTLTVVLFVFVLLLTFGMFHHEPWRDELEPWLYASDSTSIANFIQNMSTSNNPYGWYLLLHFASYLHDSPITIYIVHFALATSAIYLFLRFSPFSNLQKFLFSISYYPLFEYGILSRGYALTILLTFLFLTAFSRLPQKLYLHTLLVILIANSTSGFGIIIATALLLFMVVYCHFEKQSNIQFSLKQTLTSATVSIVGILFALITMTPKTATFFENSWSTKFDALRAIGTLWRMWSGFIPVPKLDTVEFWNTNLLTSSSSPLWLYLLITFLSLMILFFCLLTFVKKSSLFVLYCTITFGILFLIYTNTVIYAINANRYSGYLFLAFVITLWLSKSDITSSIQNNKISSWFVKYIPSTKTQEAFLSVLLVIQVFVSSYALLMDVRHPFSNISHAGSYLTQNNLDTRGIVGVVGFATSPISAYTQQPIYYPDFNTQGTFTTWNSNDYAYKNEELSERIKHFTFDREDGSILIANVPIEYWLDTTNLSVTRLQGFQGSIVPDENYTIFKLNKAEK